MDREKCTRNQDLISLIAEVPETSTWSSRKEFSIVNVQQTSVEYSRASAQFKSYYRWDNDYKIYQIDRVENPELMAAFVMRRNAMQRHSCFTTRKMFHATTRPICEKIAKEGFDWRLAATKRGNKWGHGTSFSPYADFASQFTRTEPGGRRSMLICHMLCGSTIIGSRGMKLPPLSYDTTTSGNGRVYVKYEDFTAYPAYIVSYQEAKKMTPRSSIFGYDIDDLLDDFAI